ncbi:MAG: hypothetical protein U0V70_01725 [Terriglobia bacterium]
MRVHEIGSVIWGFKFSVIRVAKLTAEGRFNRGVAHEAIGHGWDMGRLSFVGLSESTMAGLAFIGCGG